MFSSVHVYGPVLFFLANFKFFEQYIIAIDQISEGENG